MAMTPAELDQVEQAKEALPNATPGPWMMHRDICHFGTMTEIYNDSGIIAEANRECDTPIIAAAWVLTRRVIELENQVKDLQVELTQPVLCAVHRQADKIATLEAEVQRLKDWQGGDIAKSNDI